MADDDVIVQVTPDGNRHDDGLDATPNKQQTGGVGQTSSATTASSSTSTNNSKNEDEWKKKYKQNELKKQKQKAQYAKKDEYQNDKYLNIKYSLVDEQNSHTKDLFGNNRGIIFSNGTTMKISCFFGNKILEGEKMFKQAILPLEYPGFISNIVLVDCLDKIGMSGYVDIDNTSGFLDFILERYNIFYFVINITQYSGDLSIKYQPYVFDIQRIENLSKQISDGKRYLRLHLVDLITNILNTHSIASFIKFQGGKISHIENYKQLFTKILNYVKRYIKINCNNTLEFKKDILFNQGLVIKDNKKGTKTILNGNDTEKDKFTNLIKYSFNKISKNATISQAMNVFLQDAVTSMKLDDGLRQIFSSVGDVLIPFFFKQQYSITSVPSYLKLWADEKVDNTQKGNSESSTNSQTSGNGNANTVENKDNSSKEGVAVEVDDSDKTAQPATVAEQPSDDATTKQPQVSQEGLDSTDEKKWNDEVVDTLQGLKIGSRSADGGVDKTKMFPVGQTVLPVYGGKSNFLLLRNITMRDIYMPFHLAFHDTGILGGARWISQGVNIDKEDQPVVYGKLSLQPIEKFSFRPININMMSKRWKNVIFLSAQSGSAGTNCGLVFFDWFYKYYRKVFLNSSLLPTDGQENIPNVIPSFYLYSLYNKIGYAQDGSGDTFNGLFDEYNAYTFALESGDSKNEALRQMGKNITSFVLSNDEYSFQLQGNLLRRPNEIMKMQFNNLLSKSSSTFNSFNNLSGDSTTYLYVKQVNHVFSGSDYTNSIFCRKICEKI